MWNDAIESDSFNSQPTHGTQKLFTLGFISHHTLSIKTLLVWSWDRNEACYQKIFHSIKLERNGEKGMFRVSKFCNSIWLHAAKHYHFSPICFLLLKEHVTFDWRDCFPWQFQMEVNVQIWVIWKLYTHTVKYYPGVMQTYKTILNILEDIYIYELNVVNLQVLFFN